MNSDRPIRSFLDVSMITLFLLLMADRHTGNRAHEYLGVVLAGVLVLHGYLNRHWIKALAKGRYDLSRLLRLTINVLLSAAVIGVLGSAVPISKSVFSFLGIKGELLSRTFHVFFAHWSFILAAAHLGVYWKRLSARFARPAPSPRLVGMTTFVGVLIGLYGVCAFIRREPAYPLTMRSAFMILNDNDSFFLFLLDYGAIFFLCAGAARALLSLAHPKR